MSARDDGGPAFPTSAVHAVDESGGRITGSFTPAGFRGMTLRDYASLKVLTAVLIFHGAEELTASQLIGYSFDVTDAWLKARNAR